MATTTITCCGTWVGLLIASVIATEAIAARPPAADEQPFTAASRVSMDRMMAAMNITASGDVDRDFATMMISHHQGAIDMARAELRYGTDATLRRIAQGIVVEQQQEIAAMKLALGVKGSASPVPNAGAHRMSMPARMTEADR